MKDNWYKWSAWIILIIFSSSVAAAAGTGKITGVGTAMPDLATALNNLKTLVPILNRLLGTICYLMGIGLMFRGIMGLKNFGQTNSSTKGEMSGPLVYIIIGAFMIYIPETLTISSQSLFGVSSITEDFLKVDTDLGGMAALDQETLKASIQLFGYLPESLTVEGQWATLVDTVVIFMQFIGYLAFVRGMIIISQSGQPGVQPGSITKGIIHAVGGVLAINFIPVVKLMNETLRGAGT